MPIPVRPYLTTYEMAGGGRLDAEKTEASTRLITNQAVESQLAGERSALELDTMRKKQAAIDAADKLAQEMFLEQQRGGAGSAPNVPVASPVAVQPAPQQVAQEPAPQPAEAAQTFPVAPQAQDNSQPLAPNIQTTGDFARYDRQSETQQPAAPQVVEVTGKRMTPEEKAAYDAANSQPAPQQAAPAPTATPRVSAQPSAQSPASNAAAEAPAQPAAPKRPPTPAEQLGLIRGTAIINGRVNPLSDAVNDARIKAWETLAKAGKVPPSMAAEQIDSIQKGRNAQLKASLDLVERVSKINDSDMTAEEKRLKVAAVIRDREDNAHYAAYKVFLETKDPIQASQTAKDNGVPLDFTDPKVIENARRRAVRSPDYRTEQEEARKAEEASSKRAFGQNTNLPSGYRQVLVDGKVVTVDADGNKVGQPGVTAADIEQRKSSATQVNVDTKATGKLREKLAEGDATRVGEYQASAQAARGIYDRMGEIRTLVTDPKTGLPRTDLPLGTAQGLGILAQRLGLKPEEVGPRMAAEAVKMNSAEAELVAGGRMKGQGAITDSERATLRKAAAGDVANFTAADWVEYTKAQQKLQAAIIAAANDKVDNVISRNKDSAEELKTFRSEVPTAHLPKPATGSSTASSSNGSPRIIKSQAEFDALPSGTIFYDTAGNRGRKP